jgi:hypothetical protein
LYTEFSGSGNFVVAGSYENGDKTSRSIEGVQFVDHLNDYKLVHNNSAMENKPQHRDISMKAAAVTSSLTLYTAAVGTAWPLFGSPRNGQAVLYLFQKHLLC